MSGKRKGSQPESDGHGKAPRLKGHPAAEHREVSEELPEGGGGLPPHPLEGESSGMKLRSDLIFDP